MITELQCGVFMAPVKTFVIPTNCIGPMGAGLAKEARDRYHNLEAEYKLACKGGLIKPGMLFIYSQEGGDQIICFPTKRHYWDMSSLADINLGLEVLTVCLEAWTDPVAIPRLGCGLGGLEWTDVCPLVYEQLSDFTVTICHGATNPSTRPKALPYTITLVGHS